MWLVEMLLLSLVGGTMLGVGWRLFDDWRERTENERLRKRVEANLGSGWVEAHQDPNATVPKE
jgi:hypothetical protein